MKRAMGVLLLIVVFLSTKEWLVPRRESRYCTGVPWSCFLCNGSGWDYLGLM